MSPNARLKRLNLTRLPQAPFLAAPFALLVIIVLASIALLDQTQTQRDRIVTAVETQAKLDLLLTLLLRMESGQRGYLVTGNRDFLTVYQASVPLIPDAVDDISRAISREPEQRTLWAQVQPLVGTKLAEMTETIRLYDAGTLDAAFDLVRSQTGLRDMDRIRDLIQNLKDSERSGLSAQHAEARFQERLLLGINIAAVLVIIAVAFVSVIIVRRANTAMQDAQSVLKNVNSELEANVAARTAELRTANEEVQKFAYIVSHDLRSPLVNIMGFTSELETLKQSLFDRLASLQAERMNGSAGSMTVELSKEDQIIADDFDEAFAFIKASIVKMDRLINAVLTISREGNRTLRPEEIDMNGLLTTMSQAMAHQAQAVGAEFDIDALPNLVSDRLALEQIFSNLLDNALKYLRADAAGRICVKGKAEGNRVVIEVEDNGRGIDPKDQERVFELFRRAGPQDKPGEGMGLAHVRALVRRLGGVISVSSLPGKGSTFTVTLPRALANARKRVSA